MTTDALSRTVATPPIKATRTRARARTHGGVGREELVGGVATVRDSAQQSPRRGTLR